jgi:uncharacterized membrane protein YdcZ (DUF606 family)
MMHSLLVCGCSGCGHLLNQTRLVHQHDAQKTTKIAGIFMVVAGIACSHDI